MTIVEEVDGERWVHAKGAPEILLDRCSWVLDGAAGRGTERALTASDRRAADEAYNRMAERGLRTLALARRRLPADAAIDADTVERDLVLLGFAGIMDPPRPEVPAAVRLARTAGIRPIMITGDAAPTALAIANAIGLRVEKAITGTQLEAMDEATLRTALARPVLFARTTPEHKLRIVSALQAMGEIVGMTGDGVNDAPALKKAEIGIAMGVRGTDVAKGASDMVLTDDNFASILGAVEEGRRQYDNIQKFVRYLLSSNTGEVVAICANILLGGPLILLPVQILWMNLVTDGATAAALGVEPSEPGIMRRPPRRPFARILDGPGIAMIGLLGGYIGLATLWIFHHYLDGVTLVGAGASSVMHAQTVAFTAIVVLEKVNVWNFRALREPLPVVGFFTNPWVLVSWTLTVGLQVCVVYAPPLQRMLHTVPLTLEDWSLIALIAGPVLLVMEAYKWTRHLSARRAAADRTVDKAGGDMSGEVTIAA